MADKEKIKEEIERLYNLYELVNDYQRMGVCSTILDFIDSIPEEPGCEVNFTTKNEDLEEAASKYVREDFHERSRADFKAGAEWQKQKDEELFSKDSWSYIEENYPNISQEEKLRLYDMSIKSRLAGANTIKKQMKEALQTEYEKGRFDMREEMMKDAVEGTVKYRIGSAEIPQCDRRYQVLSDQTPIANAKLGDKVKIIICKTEQQ